MSAVAENVVRIGTTELPDYSGLPVEENLARVSAEIDALTLAEKLTSERTWEIAALASAATSTSGGNQRIVDPTIRSSAQYAEESGWIDSGRGLSTLQQMIATYRKWQEIGRVEGCGFWTHYEYRNKTAELLPGTSYNEAKVGRSPEAAQSFVRNALSVVPTSLAVPVLAEYIDTDEAGDVLEENEEAADHVLSAATRSVTRGKSSRAVADSVERVSVVLELIVVLGKVRELAAEDSKNPLITEAKNLMKETLRILDGIEEATPEVVNEMISDLEDLLSSQ